MCESRGGVKCGEAGEGAGLVRLEEAAGSGQEGETGGGTRSTILERVSRTTMTLKEAGES